MKGFFATHALIAASALALSSAPRLFAQQTDPRPTLDAERAAQDSLLTRRERAQWEALKMRDTTAFARLMGGDVVDIDVSGIKRTSPASTARYVLGCQTLSYALTDFRVAHVSATAVVSYKATVDATCWGQKAPSPLYVLTVYDQHGDSWLPVAHSDTPAVHWQ
jgi:ketosteroid isomerase-like protein